MFASSEALPFPTSADDGLECFRIMRILSELLEDEGVHPFIRERIVFQVRYVVSLQSLLAPVQEKSIMLSASQASPFFFSPSQYILTIYG